jgi:glycine/D-amino acid oxidase-like deaminating enzyme
MSGVMYGPGTGRLVAHLVAGETPSIDLQPLRVDRFSSLARLRRS